MTDTELLLWFIAFLAGSKVIGQYLAGVAEFRDWRWPFK